MLLKLSESVEIILGGSLRPILATSDRVQEPDNRFGIEIGEDKQVPGRGERSMFPSKLRGHLSVIAPLYKFVTIQP